jgi:arsenical pump membrane protein
MTIGADELRTLAGLAVFLAVMATVIARPRGLNEAWPAAGGAAAFLALRLLRLRDITDVGRDTAGVLLFLAGMMIVSGVAEEAGVFAWAASLAARASRSGRGLLVNVFILGAIVTALLSLDVTVIILTPVVYAAVVALRVDPLPYLYACTFVANTGSLIFPMSNLTNLLVVNALDLRFWRFAAVMALPNIAAVAMNIGVFLWLFRGRLRRRLRVRTAARNGTGDVTHTVFFRTAAAVLGLVLVGLFLAGLAARPLWPVAVAGGGAALLTAWRSRRPALPLLRRHVAWPLFSFVWGMAAIVRGLEHAGLTQGLSRLLLILPAGSAGSIAATSGIAAIGANLFNNIPMTLVMLAVLAAAPPARVFGLTAATLAGVNIGPALTPAGSLATIIWLSLVRRQGLQVPALEYLRVAFITVPLVLAASLAGLALEGGFR